MSNSPPRETEGCCQPQHFPRRNPPGSTEDDKKKEEREYERLRNMVPRLSSRTDLTEVNQTGRLFMCVEVVSF